MTIEVSYPPHKIDHRTNTDLFLAGTIDMGNSLDWQQHAIDRLTKAFGEYESPWVRNRLRILNPRRADWDSSWEQRMSHPQFLEQVNWELDGIEESDYILFHCEETSLSPVTLMELGLACGGRILDCGCKVFVSCPPNYWRRGNVEIICDRAGIPVYDDLDTTVDEIIKSIWIDWEN